MTATQVGAGGHAPTVLIRPINPEAAKYKQMWNRAEYRTVAPGEHAALAFLQQANLPPDSEVIDFGCGTGRGALMLAVFGGARVQMLDFADNCLDPEVREALTTQNGRLKFAVADLTQDVTHRAAFGYCTDVMEHIPTADVRSVLRNILAAAQHVFFQISCVDDVMGALIGEPLHLTVQPMSWWLEQMTSLGAVVHWSKGDENACMIYCSAWHDANEVVKIGRVNVSDEQINSNVRTNVEAGWKHATPHDLQERDIILLAGGPSMRADLRKIVELRAAGAALVTVNGAYDWALQHGLAPSIHIVLDARQFNARFTRKPHPTCTYLIGSQVHPDTLEGLPRERTWLWHSNASEENEKLIRERTGAFYPIPGGSTVVLRAIPLLRMLGFAKMHIFGFDSCVQPDGHHAYEQPENDHEVTMPLTCGGRTFTCTPWMVSQASEFRDLVKFLGNEVELDVQGNGLIAHMIQHGASFAHQE